jgi:CheY-like chemotaxis protein
MTYRILIVDDDITATRQVKLLLERTGLFEVREENCGMQGLAAAREFQPDVILLDVCMPDMDGGDLAFQIRHDPASRNTPIAFVTSMVSQTETIPGPYFSGGFYFIGKPASSRRLTECILSILGSRSA